MSKKIFAFIALFSVLFLNTHTLIAFADTPADQDTYTHYGSTVKDSYVDEDVTSNHNTTNYGHLSIIDVKSETAKNRRVLVQYDLSFLTSSQEIESAEMFIYMSNEASSDSNRTYGVSQILATWVEGNGSVDNIPVNEVRWANKPSASTTPTSTTVITPGTQWVSFDVTADVKNLAKGVGINAGWMIQDMNENSGTGYLAEFRSKEYSGTSCPVSPSPWGCRPYIKVIYKQYNGGVFGTVWNDANFDGIKDEGELPQQGEVISLTGPIATTTVTNADGIYYIPTGLPSGTYTVCRDVTNTTTQTSPSNGVECPNGAFGASVSIVGSEGLSLGPDFGVFQGGSVKILLNTNPTLTEDSFSFHLAHNNATTTHTLYTGQTEYIFTGLVPGESYSISQVTPSWWAQDSVSCVSGETPVSPDSFAVQAGNEVVCTFSNVKKSSLSVTNYTEPVEGTYSFTLSQPSELGDALVYDPVVIGHAETYTFTGITPGTYNLLEIIDGGPSGETAVCFVGDTIVDPRLASFNIPPGVHVQCTYNHGLFAVVQGSVFDDMDANGVRDESDSALSGWVVKLFKVTEEMVTTGEGESIITTPVSVVTEVGSKITSGAGYIFGQLNPGIYKVCEEVQSGWTQSMPTTGEDCSGSYGHFITLNFGDVVTKHFGNFSKGEVAGIVFADTNNNGVKDETEVGLSNTPVHLGGTTLYTSGNGEYHFTNVTPGEYTLTVSAPAYSSYSLPVSGNYLVDVLSGGNYVHKDFGIFTDTDTPSLPVHQTPASGAVVRALGLILDWSDSIDPSLSGVSYHYQSSVSSATTTGNALSTPIYGTTLSASQIDASGTSEGMYFWQVKACDTAYNCTSWTNPWSVTVDTTAPVSTFTSPNPDSNIEDEHIVIAGSTTDAHMVASTTLAYAPYIQATEETAASCGAYTSITSLVNETASTTFNWSYNWTPETDGVYCLTAHGQDEAGNTEASPFVTNITFKKKVVTTTSGGGSSSGGGTGGSGTGGGSTASNGPIVGSFGGSQSGGAPVMLAVGGSPDGAIIPTQNSSTEPSSYQSTSGTSGAFSGNVYTGGSTNDSGLTDAPRASTTRIQENNDTESESDNNVAAVSFAGEWNNWYWLWLLLLICIILGVYYSTRRRNE